MASHASVEGAALCQGADAQTPTARVAELIALAWAKRISRYRWCPLCRRRVEPEHMTEAICHGCAERKLGVLF